MRKDPEFIEFYNKKHSKAQRDVSGDDFLAEESSKRNKSSIEHKLHYFEAMESLISRMVEDNGEWFIAIAPKIENRLRFV